MTSVEKLDYLQCFVSNDGANRKTFLISIRATLHKLMFDIPIG